MGFVKTLRATVANNRTITKIGKVGKLRSCIAESRREEREVEEYLQCMEMYKKIADDPFQFTFDDILLAEDVLDAMILSAIIDQKKHRRYAEDALRQSQS